MKSDTVTELRVINQDLGAAGTMNTVELPGGTYAVKIKARGNNEIRMHPNEHTPGTYYTIEPGAVFEQDRFALGNKRDINARIRVFYLSAPGLNTVAEVVAVL